MARIQGTSQSFSVAAQNTLEETQKLLVRVAKREHNRVLNTSPRPVSFERFVDGKQGAPEEAVKANGTILYTYPRLEVVAQFALETLFDLSPVLSGEYRKSHTLFLNGTAVPNLRDYKSGDEVAISNPVPYARKIEIGKMTMRVPGTERVYAQAEKIIRRQYGNIARIRFTYRGLMGMRFIAKKHKPDLRYPALILSEI